MYEILFIFYIPIQSLTQTNSNLLCPSSLKQNLLALAVGVSVLDLDLVTNTYNSRHSLIYRTRNNSFRVWKLSYFFKFTLWRIFNLLNFDQKSKNVFNFAEIFLNFFLSFFFTQSHEQGVGFSLTTVQERLYFMQVNVGLREDIQCLLRNGCVILLCMCRVKLTKFV